MSLLSWNVHGLTSVLTDDALNYLSLFDIISLVETWTNNDSDVENMLNGYTAFSLHGKRRSRYGRNPGGITVLISSDHVNKFIRCINVTDYAIYLRFDRSHFDTFDKT